MEHTFIDTRRRCLISKNNNRKKTKKRTLSVLFCIIVLTLGFLLGASSKAEAAAVIRNTKDTAYISDQRIKDKMDQIYKAGQSGSKGSSGAISNTHTDTGDATDSMQTNTPYKATAEWSLILVNQWNKLPDGYEVTLRQLKNGQAVDERCYPDLQQMLDDCRAAGLSPVICSSYRSQETQKRLFNYKVTYYTNLGYSQKNAETEAAKSIAAPGTSEHHLGLAVDIVDIMNQNLDSSQENTAVQQWLLEHSWKYGFILRYPSDKSGITGIIYEPWHYRYVGKEAAAEIHAQGICLEDYLVR